MVAVISLDPCGAQCGITFNLSMGNTPPPITMGCCWYSLCQLASVIGWRARWPIPGCVLTAVMYMFGGAASARLQHTGIILSYSVFPLALLLLQLALERRSHLLAITFAIAAASI